MDEAKGRSGSRRSGGVPASCRGPAPFCGKTQTGGKRSCEKVASRSMSYVMYVQRGERGRGRTGRRGAECETKTGSRRKREEELHHALGEEALLSYRKAG